MKTVNKKGFTLIEVVLVLAIGGLIFLLAFLAFQQVSRNRRDTQRRSDVARMAAIHAEVKANSPSAAPGTGCSSAWFNGIDDENFEAPSGSYTCIADGESFTTEGQYKLLADEVCMELESGNVCRDVE